MRYYWLKLKEHFFDDTGMKYLKTLEDGDKIIIVYLRMQLLSLRTQGIIQYNSILPGCIEELALILKEDQSIISRTLEELEKLSLIEIWEDQTIYLTAVKELAGSESDGAARMRKMRSQQESKPKKATPKASQVKNLYGDSVTMTQWEYDKLAAEYGVSGADRMIEILDNYKGSSGKKYKSDYKTILNWVVSRYKEEMKNSPKATSTPKTSIDYSGGESFI